MAQERKITVRVGEGGTPLRTGFLDNVVNEFQIGAASNRHLDEDTTSGFPELWGFYCETSSTDTIELSFGEVGGVQIPNVTSLDIVMYPKDVCSTPITFTVTWDGSLYYTGTSTEGVSLLKNSLKDELHIGVIL